MGDMRKSLMILLFSLFGTALFGQRQIGMNKPGMNGPGVNKPVEHVEGTYITVNGINMYYEQYGEGNPLLLIHGNGGSVESFDAQINYLSRKFRVIVPESRGQGRTGNNADSLTYELMAEDYYLFLEELNLDSVNVIGYSDGGIIGLLLARDYPGKVGKLICIGANLRPDSTALQADLVDDIAATTVALRDSVAQGKRQYTPELMLSNLIMHHPNIDAESLTAIDIPVMIVSGDHDLVKIEHTVEIYQQLQKGQLAIYPGTTHNILGEMPQLFNNAAQRFFLRAYTEPGAKNANQVEIEGQE